MTLQEYQKNNGIYNEPLTTEELKQLSSFLKLNVSMSETFVTRVIVQLSSIPQYNSIYQRYIETL